MLAVDWLQITILHTDINATKFSPAKGVEFRLTDKKTQNFNELYEVTQDGITIGWITAKPKEDFLDKTLMIMKFENSYLYDDFLDRKIVNFLAFNGLKFRGYTRVDLSYDFNRFENGMHPKEFINHYLRGVFQKTDKCKIGLHGSNKEKFEPEYIKWGTNNSDLSYYLYNKTIEMQDVKHKTHIASRWLSAGYDMEDVWRLEFRVKSQLKLVVDASTGESKTLQEYGLDLLTAENIKLLYSALYTRYFDFRHNNGQNRIQRMPRVELFTTFRSYLFFVRDLPKSDVRSNRCEKIFIKMLCQENEELNRFFPSGFRNHEPNVLHDLISLKITQGALRDWAYNKNYVPTECLGVPIAV